MMKIGEMLLEAGLITKEQLETALEMQKKDGGKVGYNLVKIGAITEEKIGEFLSKKYNVPAINLDTIDIPKEILSLIGPDHVQKFQVIPISKSGRTLTVAMSDPGNMFVIDDLKFVTGYDIDPVVAAESNIRRAIDRFYDQADSLARMMQDMKNTEVEVVEEEQKLDTLELRSQADDAPIVKLVNGILIEAIQKQASDIHIEPYEKNMRVRFRIDGTLYEMASPPLRMKDALVSRIKIMSDLDISERRIPQDGRIKIKLKDRAVDLRVSCLPTLFGEKVVLRILDKGNLLSLDKLGFLPEALERFKKAIDSPYGMILVTGPTGSGKTNTLYSALSTLNRSDINIMTAEDPVEFNMQGINQVNVRTEIGLTFAAALKAFLRQDPNVIMVGEIRDLETGEIAVKAALTGHLVFSTLHTNDAPSTISRMIDMGIEPFLITSSTRLIIAQRLLRRVCTNCKEEEEVHPEALISLGVKKEEIGTFKVYKGKGCPKCNNTGYKGRIGVFQVMPITPEIKRLILDGASVQEIEALSIEQGVDTLRMDAIKKMKAGITSIHEVLRETTAE